MFKKATSIFLIMLCVLVSGFNVSAEEKQPYTIKPVLPSNQDKGITQYISVSTDKSSIEQNIEFLVTNNTSETMKLKVDVFNALTAPSGVIQYKPGMDEKNSKLMKEDYALDKYVDVQEKVTVEGGMSKVVQAKVSIGGGVGTILGGVAFQNVIESEENSKEKSQFQIDNEVNNLFGVQVNFPADIEKKFIIGEPFVDPMPTYYAIRLPITLDSPHLVKEASIDYVVKDEDNQELFGKKGVTNLNFAPQSRANFALPWEEEDIKEGYEYTISGTLYYGENKLDFNKKFEFNQDNNDGGVSNNSLSVPKINDMSLWWPWVIGLLILILIGLLLRRNMYVLFHEEDTAPKLVDNSHVEYERIRHIKEAINHKKYKFKHYYKRKKGKDGEVIYKYVKTKNIKNK
ncbi:WxL protein peptidoglycan domain-containing protein [Virgibacillus sp. Bac332]|uniref:WxL protein peptidoglycan domain-containing protein n=1 Tax=Virgibacillus sp. Bac332 TaxID=2419842 RepID=UPI000EF49622|nr:DUF916 domain-containing protein [Virgibacillus sp. Bac332]